MLFNSSDRSNSIIADIDFLLFGNSFTFNTDYSLPDRTRNVNIAYDEAVAEMYKADQNFKWDDTTNPDLPLATIDLEANLDQYTMLDSFLVIHRVRVKDQNGSFYTLQPAVRSELTDDELNSIGSASKYIKEGASIFPFPVPNYGYADGFEVEFQRGASHFTPASTDVGPGFNSQYHEFLSIFAAHRYAIANGMQKKAQALGLEKERVRMAIREHYQLRSPDEKPKLKLRPRNIRHFALS